MTPAQVAEAWNLMDRSRLAELARRGPPAVFASISGAHLYGFASRDSDVDLRGAFLHPLRSMLSLRPPPETITVDEKTDIELDWVAHDLRKFVRMLTEDNGYVLEQLYSPLVVVESPTFIELRELARGCFTRPTAKHFLGFGRGRRKRLRQPHPTVKHVLYGYRVYLTGIHLMRTGELVSNLPVLNDIFRLSQIDELIARKQQAEEIGDLLVRKQHAARIPSLRDAPVHVRMFSLLSERDSVCLQLRQALVHRGRRHADMASERRLCPGSLIQKRFEDRDDAICIAARPHAVIVLSFLRQGTGRNVSVLAALSDT